MVSLQFTTLEGGNVSEAEIVAARRDLDERTFKQEYEATFVEYSVAKSTMHLVNTILSKNRSSIKTHAQQSMWELIST